MIIHDYPYGLALFGYLNMSKPPTGTGEHVRLLAVAHRLRPGEAGGVKIVPRQKRCVSHVGRSHHCTDPFSFSNLQSHLSSISDKRLQCLSILSPTKHIGIYLYIYHIYIYTHHIIFPVVCQSKVLFESQLSSHFPCARWPWPPYRSQREGFEGTSLLDEARLVKLLGFEIAPFSERIILLMISMVWLIMVYLYC